MPAVQQKKEGTNAGLLLFLLFLGLKLGHVIGWSWWWVAAPLWVPFALVLTVWAIGAAIFVAAAALGRR